MLGLTLVLASLACQPGLSAQPAPRVFVHITDTHVTPGPRADQLQRFLAGLAGPNAPALVVNTGDITELGTDAEYTAYAGAVKDSPVPIHATPGNHDVRWAPLGKEGFTKACGPLYRSFTQAGCHFVLLDTTVVLEHWGHFDGAQLAWLAADLKRIPRGMPVFLFMHHWFGREGTNIDNAADLLALLAPHNVVAAFIGHGHSDIRWRANGIECFMARGLYQGSHHRIAIADGRATVTRHTESPQKTRVVELANIPLHGRPRIETAFRWLDPGLPVLERRRFAAHLKDATGGSLASDLEWSLDDGPSQTGLPEQEVTVDASVLSPGWHEVAVSMTTPAGDRYERREPFLVATLGAPVATLWERPTRSTIQGSPTLDGDLLLVGSFDGTVYAHDAGTGRLRWKRATRGGVFSTPTVASDTVYIASMDHGLYALDRGSGKVRWRFDAGAPLFATASVWGDTVCIGANRAIYGLDAKSGRRKWQVDTGSFFQSRAAAADGVFILGGWDNALYAVATDTGQLRWKQPMGRTDGGRGRISFYYSPAIASPTVSGNRVYVCTNDGLLHCLDIATGAEQWAVRAPTGGDTFGYSSPLVHEGRVYLGGLGDKGRGNCYALSAETGELVWRAATGADNYDSSPALVGGLIAIGSVRGRVNWLDPGSGSIIAAYQPRPGFSFSTPTGNREVTYTASMNSRIVALTTPATKR
jgi:outer membrane protein assembly factor BamB